MFRDLCVASRCQQIYRPVHPLLVPLRCRLPTINAHGAAAVSHHSPPLHPTNPPTQTNKQAIHREACLRITERRAQLANRQHEEEEAEAARRRSELAQALAAARKQQQQPTRS